METIHITVPAGVEKAILHLPDGSTKQVSITAGPDAALERHCASILKDALASDTAFYQFICKTMERQGLDPIDKYQFRTFLNNIDETAKRLLHDKEVS